ncbi:MAG: universal stress protein [Chitinophagaceae bacterium]
MKKILLLINNYEMQDHVMHFVSRLAKIENVKINCLFLGRLKPDEGEEGRIFPGTINSGDQYLTKETNADQRQHPEKYQVKKIEDFFKAEGLSFYTQIVLKNYLDVIVNETNFADLVVGDKDLNVLHFSMNSFISLSQCPVFLVPENSLFFDEVILTYDGQLSSIHAMKLFTYLFPWCGTKKTFLISVLPDNILQMEYDALVKEWFLLHYHNGQVVVLRGNAKSEIIQFINQQKNTLVVMGAFGRSALSRLFKESLALPILEKTSAPVFISHL